jgi:hypothetical protein
METQILRLPHEMSLRLTWEAAQNASQFGPSPGGKVFSKVDVQSLRIARLSGPEAGCFKFTSCLWLARLLARSHLAMRAP